jgi:hypothetical protein
MCDISLEENKAIASQLAMNIPLNGDVINIIKSFVFEDKNVYIQKKLHKQAMRTIKSSIEYDRIEYKSYQTGNLVGHWTVELSSIEGHFQMQCLTCLACGKYVSVNKWDLQNDIMHNSYIVCINDQH